MPPKKKLKNEKVNTQKTDENSADDSDGEVKRKPNRSKKTTAAADKTQKVLQNKASTEFDDQDFSNDSKTADGKLWNLKIASWNVDGIRAWAKKGGLEYIAHEDPDVLCLQETKCSDAKLPKETTAVPGYHAFWCHGETDGYAGLGMYSKVKPISVKYGIGNPEFDKEGRLITAEFDGFYLVNVYVPNSGRKLVTLPKRMEWDSEFLKFIEDLETKKPVILCGDMNVAHNEIDIANPKSNKRNAGFTQEERDNFSKILKSGFIDSFRTKYPEAKGAYTFWTYMANARKKNVGWRLDYFLLSQNLSSNFCDSAIRNQVFGSDHCPIVLFINS